MSMDRPLPHDDDAERALLGCVMLDPNCIGDVELIMHDGATEFADPKRAYIYATLRDITLEGSGIDGIAVRQRMEHDKRWQEIGGWECLAGLVNAVPSALRVRLYARILHEHHVARQAIAETWLCQRRLAEEPGAEAIIAETVGRLANLAEAARPRLAPTFGGMMEEAFAETEAVCDGMVGPSTGFGELDRLTLGWRRGELAVIGGGVSHGKTSMLVQMAHSLVYRQGVPALFCSLEMSAHQLALRFAGIDSHVPPWDIQRNQLREDQRQLVNESRKRAANVPLYVDERSGLTTEQIHGRAIMEVARHHIRAVFVDYVQIMGGERGRNISRYEQIGMMTAGLKAMAKSLNLSVIVTAQLDRKLPSSKRRPRLHDLRESGSIEQDADLVLLIHRPIVESQDEHGQIVEEPSPETELILAKQRNGPTGMVKLYYDRPKMRFDLAAPTPYVPPPPTVPAEPPLWAASRKDPF